MLGRRADIFSVTVVRPMHTLEEPCCLHYFLLFSSCLQPDNAYVCAEEEETGRGDKERLNLLTGLLCLALTCIGAVEKVYIHVFSLVPKPRLF